MPSQGYESTILDQGHVLMEVTAQCCIFPHVFCNVLHLSGRPLRYRCCAVVGGALWKLGNNGLGMLLEEVYVRIGD
jgi:hypothetical protein